MSGERDREALEVLLRRTAREHLGLADGEHWPSSVSTAQADAVQSSDWLADLIAKAEQRGRVETLREAAVAGERLRQSNPINGDCSNHMLTRVLDAIAKLAGDDHAAVVAAVTAEQVDRRRRDDMEYWRYQAINAKARGDGDSERRALDQMALLERAETEAKP